jgi:protein-S-isoprenylcysteine O-methyltransferase Ste14
MYSGIVLIILCYPLALGSLFTFIPASIIIALFVLRTALEDRTLLSELPGYTDYTRKVRYRLLPGIW